MTAWDTSVFGLIQRVQAQTSYLHPFAAAFALWGGLVLMAAFVMGCWWFAARRRPDADRAVAVLALTGVASVVGLLTNQRLLSPYVGRPRPCRVLPSAHVLVPCTDDYSMPSDHAVVAGALAVGLIIFSRRIGALVGLIAVLLAAARVYVGVHYPSDVLVGLGVGGSISAMMIATFVAPTRRLCMMMSAGRLRWLVRSAQHRAAADVSKPSVHVP